MIITRTPYRISFFGGGTDYPSWYSENGGAVLGTTIDKYCYISVRHLPNFFEHTHRIVYSKVETVRTVDQINHPAVRGVLSYFDVQSGLEIHHDGDLPARSGLGSSSSFTVGLIQALRALNGHSSSPKYLAEQAIHIEQNIIREAVGSQDQIWAAYGGTNLIKFLQDGSFEIQPIIIGRDRRAALESHLMLFFTGRSRLSEKFAQGQIDNLQANKDDLKEIHKMVEIGHQKITDDQSDLRDFGRLLHESWQRKRKLAKGITNDEIDELYNRALDAGAIGGKLLGAGGGGFLLIFVEPEKRKNISSALAGLVEVPIKIGSPGSRVIVFEPDEGVRE